MTDAPVPQTRRRRRRRRRTSVVGVLGEILLTAGAVMLLYVAWQLWLGDVIYGAERAAEAQNLSEQWQEEYEASQPTTPAPQDTDDPTIGGDPTTAQPVILPEAGDAEVFANLYVPRFGSDYVRKVAGGVTRARTLDPIGVGHYSDTAMPGETGNVAFAAHRTTFSAPFNQIADLRVGDPIVIETPDGWYTYRFRTLEYVTPDSVDVLLPVPQRPGVEADGSYLTMTSCSPMYSMTERIVAYSVFDSFTPRSAGEPTALTEAAS